jgi:uncharacterized membrane protein YhaH (DUF805 family)
MKLLQNLSYLYFSFKGRISKFDANFWFLFILPIFVLLLQIFFRVSFSVLNNNLGNMDLVILWISFFLLLGIILYFSISITIKRLHDLNLSGKEMFNFNPLNNINTQKRMFFEEWKLETNDYGNQRSIFPEKLKLWKIPIAIGVIALTIFIHITWIQWLSSSMMSTNPLINLAKQELITNSGVIQRFWENISIIWIPSFTSQQDNIGGKSEITLTLSWTIKKWDIQVSLIKEKNMWKVSNIWL